VPVEFDLVVQCAKNMGNRTRFWEWWAIQFDFVEISLCQLRHHSAREIAADVRSFYCVHQKSGVRFVVACNNMRVIIDPRFSTRHECNRCLSSAQVFAVLRNQQVVAIE
jgi:hypothetical protein